MKERYYSLDVFRGATVAFMILVNNQMGPTYAPLDHAPWFGLTPTDLVFPFFLFAVGNALSFVMPRFEQMQRHEVLQKIIKRSVLIFIIGFLLSWFPFFRWSHDSLVIKTFTWVSDDGNLAGVRVMGVLARIALCYLFGALIVLFSEVIYQFYLQFTFTDITNSVRMWIFFKGLLPFTVLGSIMAFSTAYDLKYKNRWLSTLVTIGIFFILGYASPYLKDFLNS